MKAFDSLHPFSLFAYFTAQLLISMFVANPLIQGISLLGGIALYAVLTMKKGRFRENAWFLLLFLLVTLTNPLFSHNGETVLFFLNRYPVTLEALLYGAAMGVMLLSVVFWCRCFGLIVTQDKFIYLFGRILPRLSLVLCMSLRFIPLFTRRLRLVRNTQKALGLYAGDTLADRLRHTVRLFSALLGQSAENAMETAMSMRARGYGLPGRSQFSLFRFTLADSVFLLTTGMLTALIMLGVGAGEVAFAFYPRLSGLLFSRPAAATYAATAVLAFLPVCLVVREEVIWRHCISKI